MLELQPTLLKAVSRIPQRRFPVEPAFCRSAVGKDRKQMSAAGESVRRAVIAAAEGIGHEGCRLVVGNEEIIVVDEGAREHGCVDTPLNGADLLDELAHPFEIVKVSSMDHGGKGDRDPCVTDGLNPPHGPLEGTGPSDHVVPPGPAVEAELDLLHLEPADVSRGDEGAVGQ